MSGALLPIAVSVGAPLIRRILERKIGAGNAELVEEVVRQVSDQLNILPEDLPRHAKEHPEETAEAVSAVEQMAPELIGLYTRGLEYQMAVMRSEAEGPAWKSAWRPLAMYLLLFLWLWHFFLAYLMAQVVGWSIPPGDGALIFQLTAVFAGLYMGGHTVKDMMGKWVERRR